MAKSLHVQPILLTCASGQLGGTEMRMIEEGRALGTLGYAATVATSRFGQLDAYSRLLTSQGIPHFELTPPPVMNAWRWRHLHYLHSRIKPVRRLRQFKLAHVFFPWTNQGLDHLWLLSRSGVPLVISVHNSFPATTMPPWHTRLLRQAFRNVVGVYGVSDSALAGFEQIFGSFFRADMEKSVIYNFVDIDRFIPSADRRAAARAKLGISEDALVVGSVGRFDKQKRPVDLVRTFALIREQLPLARLLLVGSGGDLEGEVRAEITRQGLEHSVTVLGFQPDIENLFPAMDVHLLLSRNEGFGIVTAEAMACGVPVVGTHVPGTTEVIGDCPAGRLVELGNNAAAADNVVELLRTDPAARSMLAAQARENVTSRFSRSIWRDRIEGFYARALSKTGT